MVIGAALGKKDVPPLWLLAVEAAKVADLAAAHRMHARHPVLDALHMEESVHQVDFDPSAARTARLVEARAGMR